MTGSELRSALESADMPVYELARRLEVSPSTVFRWRAGLRGISKPVARVIQQEIDAYRSRFSDR